MKGLITLEGSCSLPNNGLQPEDFGNIPYLAMKGDYAATSTACQTTVDAIRARRAAGQGTASADYLKLDETGPVFRGITHIMMMLGTNNLEIADVILNWVERSLSPKKNGKAKKSPATGASAQRSTASSKWSRRWRSKGQPSPSGSARLPAGASGNGERARPLR